MTTHLPPGAHKRTTFVADDVVFDQQLEVFRHDFNDSASKDPSETQENLCVTIAGPQKAKAITIDRNVAIALARFILNEFGIAHSAPPSTQVQTDVIDAAKAAVVAGFSEDTCDELTRAMTVLNEELTKGIR